MDEREWLEEKRKNNYSDFSDDQWKCIMLLCELECGFHHFDSKPKIYGLGISYNCYSHGFATFDFPKLTTLVLLAHRDCIRVEINSCNMQYIKICLWKRHKREGSYSERHPTIETAIEIFNSTIKE